MTALYEDPLPFLVMGAVVGAALLVGFFKTGRKSLLVGLAAVVVLLLALLALERAVVTDREQVEQTLFQIAEAVQRNDIDAALEHISLEAPRRTDAKQELEKIRFQEVKIKSNLEIEVQSEAAPPTATTKFNVVVVADGGLGMEHYPRYVEVTFAKQGDRWVVVDYQHYEPTHGMQLEPVK